MNKATDAINALLAFSKALDGDVSIADMREAFRASLDSQRDYQMMIVRLNMAQTAVELAMQIEQNT